LLSYLREKLDETPFFSVTQLHQRALACESLFKETSKSIDRTIHLVERDSSDDESADIYTVEFVCPTKAKSSAWSYLQPVQKNRQEEIKFTFNVAKYDRIFVELLKNNNIKLTHTIPSIVSDIILFSMFYIIFLTPVTTHVYIPSKLICTCADSTWYVMAHVIERRAPR
jgi:predicted small integral membrane protein